METLRLPELYCPFAVSCSRDADAVEHETIVWARRWGLIPHAAAERRLRAVGIGALMGRVYPMLSRHDLQLLTDWTTWGFIWDDRCGRPPLRDHPELLRARQARMLAILGGAAPTPADDALCGALAELRQRLLQKTTPAGLERFIRSVEQFFEACHWEATNRALGIIPDVATYQRMRPLSGGVYTYTELFGIIEGLAFPDAVRDHPVVERLTLMANNVVCWINDIVSLGKEIDQGDVHNLVLVLRHEQQLSLQEALDRTAALVNAEVRAFLDLARRLPSFGAPVDAALDRYLVVLRSWMRGSLEWSSISGRYQASATVAVDEAGVS